jgi:hypothetical protein
MAIGLHREIMIEARTSPAGLRALRFDNTEPVFFTVVEAAQFLRVSMVTLGRWRTEGRGPHFRKFGRRVIYAKADLLEWADGQSRASTSSASLATVHKAPTA